MRDLSVRRRRVIDQLVDQARELLTEGGHATGRSTLDGVGNTLLAATVDEKAAEAVRAGRLERELASPTGLEALGEGVPHSGDSKRRDRARDRVRKAEEDARAAEETAEASVRETRRLEQQAERARQDAERARRMADRAAEKARELRKRAEDLRR